MIETTLNLQDIAKALVLADQIVALAAKSADPKAIAAIINFHLAQKADAIWIDHLSSPALGTTKEEMINIFLNEEGAFLYFVKSESPVSSNFAGAQASLNEAEEAAML